MHSEVYGSVFVCRVSVCLCVDCCSCSRINEVQVRVASSHVFLGLQFVDLQIMLCSRVIARFAYLECHCSLFRTVRNKTCPCSVSTLLSS